MAKLELTLYGKKGFQKTVTEDYVSGQKLLDYLKLLEEVQQSESITPIEFLEKKIEFVAGLFTSEKVTPVDILKGVRSWELVEVIDGLLNRAMGAKESDDPKPVNSLSETLENVISDL